VSAREQVLAALRRRAVVPVDHPGGEGPWSPAVASPDLFCERLAAAGGQAVRVGSIDELIAAVRRQPVVTSARRVVSLLEETSAPAFEDAERGATGDLSDVDFVLAPGVLGVAENGAVWVGEPTRSDRSAYYLTQHLGLVVAEGDLVGNMHDAYRRLGAVVGRFGCFISGPSKTADIEQALVIGAHGAR